MAGSADERPHRPGEQSDWVEAWLFDLVQADASIAMSIELLIWPQRGQAGFHASVVRPGRPLISLVEFDAAAPRPPSLELRAPGLWADVGIQTPLDHVTVDIEAFAVALDDPNDALNQAFGIRTPLGSELEWETAADRRSAAVPDGYEIPCIVHGELLLGDAVIEIDGWGWRSHRWGAPSATDRRHRRGRSATGMWLHDREEGKPRPHEILGRAPVPDPTLDARLEQHLVRTAAGDISWVRAVDLGV